jgi:Ca-activated chloride channel homolog
MVTFAWPWLLVALAAVPLVIVWYRRLLRTRAGRRAELAALGLAGPAPGRGGRGGPPPPRGGVLSL